MALSATVCGIIAFFIFEAAVYNGIFLRRIIAPSPEKGPLAAPFAALFGTAWLLAFVSYLRAYTVNPGTSPEQWREFVHSAGESLPLAPARPEWQPGKATFCRKCDFPRPERAKHCKLCAVCVLRMDHHCPWINNCVGFHNQKFFVLTGIYGCMAAVIAVATSLPEIIGCAATVGDTLRFEWGGLKANETAAFLIFAVASILVVVFLGPLVATHVPLALKNMTTIEDYYDNMHNPYDHGSALTNLAQVFGSFGPDWFFPVNPRRPLTDGISFARANEPLGSEATSEFGSDVWEDLQVEQLWRQRFRVQTPTVAESLVSETPLADLARWWNGK